MFDQQNVIKEINKSCSIYFDNSTFILQPSKANRFNIAGSYTSKAVNRNKNSNEEINVIKWFKDFWLFVDVRFEASGIDIPNTFISISVFQGEEKDERKFQLFRAEWDNFEDNIFHPQPHWHIYADQNLENSFEEMIELLEGQDGFADFLNEERSKGIDLKNMHFAMNGLWSTKGSHIHKIDREEIMLNWFQGVLSHIRIQLEHVA
ncbi:hypothetical protein [Mucilaginibacter terrae]|uniref:Uncharacterized protein n=1 Tax=Mucilaginibacter terrae TaxID=1955052 RepID=A0ABU3GXG8_9SPHI|nr:hypothetical protein [Mucilaginibacter terrae]MDT3404291.1 hypothetical protein [Mucilaginibacter terrae]